MTNEDFASWWNSYRNNEKIPSELKEMEDYFVRAGLQYSSNFWNVLNKLNIEQITESGYENFKQSVTRNYFTWVVNLDHSYAINLKKALPKPSVLLPREELTKVHDFFTEEESISFNAITQHFLNYILQMGGRAYLAKLEEPLVGNPPCLIYQGRRISQDIFNSLLEYIPISRHCPLEKISRVIEIGAGSGRTAFCFISLLPHIKYIIVDFPPALYLSQSYLSDVFPKKKILKFRKFNNFEEISAEYAESDIIFLTPDQITKLPDHSADIFLAIDCLHEMKSESVNYYFKEAQRLCTFFYFKCWQNTVVPFDNVIHTSESYPVGSNWQVLFKEACVVPSEFFHAFYKMVPN